MHIFGKTRVPVWLLLAVFSIALSLILFVAQHDPQNAVGVLFAGMIVSYLASMAERPAPAQVRHHPGQQRKRRHHKH